MTAVARSDAPSRLRPSLYQTAALRQSALVEFAAPNDSYRCIAVAQAGRQRAKLKAPRTHLALAAETDFGGFSHMSEIDQRTQTERMALADAGLKTSLVQGCPTSSRQPGRCLRG